MISLATVRKLALGFEAVEEKPHFEKTSFRVKNKIFATVNIKAGTVVLKLSEIDQSVFSDYNSQAIYPGPGAWGRQGWTVIDMKKVRKDVFTDAITTAWRTVAPLKLSTKHRLE